jgi:uncharacterized membrane protein YbjE (DUF340 family)
LSELDIHAVLGLVSIPSTTLLGCVAAYVYSDQKGIKSSRRFLNGLFPRRSSAFYLRLDFAMSAIIGTCIAIILYSPITAYQALAAGVGWTAAFSVLKSEAAPQKPGPAPKVNQTQNAGTPSNDRRANVSETEASDGPVDA